MWICLPAHFRARTVSHKACVTLSGRNNQESWNGVHSVSQTFPPLKDPIDGYSHTFRQRSFRARVGVDKINRAGASGRENTEVIALREKRIESSESVRAWVVTARNVCLRAESRFERNVQNAITRFRCNGPRVYVCGAKGSELPKGFIVKIPARICFDNRARETATMLCRTS